MGVLTQPAINTCTCWCAIFVHMTWQGIVAYGAQQYAQALEHLSRAVQTNPQASGVTVAHGSGLLLLQAGAI